MGEDDEKRVDLFKRYKFDISIREKIRKHTFHFKPDNWHGFADVLEDWLFIYIFNKIYILFYFFVSINISFLSTYYLCDWFKTTWFS
jgi:hypothetical protein